MVSKHEKVMAEYTPETFKVLLKKLVQRPDDFEAQDCAACFQHLCVLGGKGASDAQAGAFLTALTLSGLDQSAGHVAAAAAVLREHAVQIKSSIHLLEANQETPEPSSDREWDYRESDKLGDGYRGVVDVVGTGGDGWDTFNVSTSAAVVVAGTGIRVAKHGSKAATSSSGSADLLISLGCSLSFPPSQLPKFLPASPFLFLFAPHYHPSLAHIAPIRRSLNFRTIFNVLGPLINPAMPQRMVLGVAKKELGDCFIEVLRLLGVEKALVVCGKEGLDEVSCEGETWTWYLESGQISQATLHPTRDFGLPTHPLSAVRGATPGLNAQTFKAILQNTAPPAHLSAPISVDSPSIDAIRDYVLLNAAVLIKVSGRVDSWKQGVAVARESIESGNAWKAFEGFIRIGAEAMTSDEAIKGLERKEDDGGVAAKGGEVKSWLHSEVHAHEAEQHK